MYGINFDGLRERPTYDKLIDYVMNKQEQLNIQTEQHFSINSLQLSNEMAKDY